MSAGEATSAILRYRFIILLGMLTVLLLVAPALIAVDPGATISGVTMTAALSAMLLAAAFTVCTRRLQVIVAMSLMVPALVLKAISTAVDSATVDIVHNALGLAALGYVLLILLRHLFSSRRVPFDTIAASLCVFLLLGVWWAMAHTVVDLAVPESFRFAYAEDVASGAMGFEGERSIFTLYYSFVTLTTLGYGDIVPVSGVARMVAIVEAVTGQVYLTVLVARLVGLHIAHSLKE